MVISLNDVDIIAMPRMHIGELTEPCRLLAWYRPLFHFAYTSAHILPNATLAFAVLVINMHCPGETASRVDECIMSSVSGVGSSPALATCETSQLLLAGVPGVFLSEISRFRPPTDWSVS